MNKKIIALWSTPRSRSTAFMWMMMQRGDFLVLQEPFGRSAYYSEERIFERAADVMPKAEYNYQNVWQDLQLQARKSRLFIKDFPYYFPHMVYDLGIAKAIAQENNCSHAIEFIQTDLHKFDLSTTTIKANQFDVILAMLYSGHPRFDRHQIKLTHALLEKYLAPHGSIIPHQIKWFAYACDWARHDFSQYCLEASRYVYDLERQWGLKFQTIRNYCETKVDDWGAMVDNLDVYSKAAALFQYKTFDRLDRPHARMLSLPTLVADVHYEQGKTEFPEHLTLEITEPGRITAIIWVRELLHDGLLISSRETASLVRQPLWLNQGEQGIARLDDIWRQTNVVSVTKYSNYAGPGLQPRLSG